MQSTISICLACQRGISSDEPYVAILWQYEQLVRRAFRDAITVNRSDEIAHLHQSCSDEDVALRVSTAVAETLRAV